MVFTVGVDVGNSRTKSAHTELISGYTQYEMEQLLAKKSLYYNGRYYVESLDSPFPYVEDKTEDGQCLILTLFSIAKEVIYRVHQSGRAATRDMIQEEIRKYDNLNLAVGLPPGHFKRARDLKAYYLKELDGVTTFKYDQYEFSFATNNVEVYAQGLSAALMNDSVDVVRVSQKFYILDIGGYTVDVIPMIKGDLGWTPDSDNIRSLPMGVRPMCEKVVGHIQTTLGETFDERIMEDIIREKQGASSITFVSDDIKKEIFNYTRLYTNQLIDKVIQCGCTVNYNPVLYIGGGSLLLRPFLEGNTKVGHAEWIENSNANAEAYEKYMKSKYKTEQ